MSDEIITEAERSAYWTARADRTAGARLRISKATWIGSAIVAADFWITGLPRPVVGTLIDSVVREDGGAMVELEVTPDDYAFLGEHLGDG